MLETKTDQQRPEVDRLIDSFVEIIKSMLINSQTPHTLHKKILESFQQDNVEIAISHVRRLLHMTDSDFKAHWAFETDFRAAGLSNKEKTLFSSRIQAILLDQQEPLTQHPYQYWEKMGESEQRKLYDALRADSDQTIRICIGSDWELFSLTSFAYKISTGYELFLNLYMLENYQVIYGSREFAALYGDYFHPSDFGNLQILQMKYASPGHFDLLGIGKVLEQLVQLINKIVHWKREYKLSKLENTKKQLDLLVEMNIDLDKLGLDIHTKEQMQMRLTGAAKELFDWLEPEQITGAELRSGEQEQSSGS